MVARSLSYRDFLRFGVAELSEKFDVHVLDFSRLLNKQTFPKDQLLPDINLKTIAKFSDLINFIKNNDITICFDYLPNGIYLLIIRRLFSYQGAINVRTCLGPIPIVINNESIVTKIRQKIKTNNSIFKVLKNIVFRLSKKLEPHADVLVVSGKICVNKGVLANQKKIIWAHSFDYQNYVEFNKLKHNNQKDKNYIVFLDQMSPTHPDYIFHKNQPPVTEAAYYKSMNHFFDHLEKETGMSVIVAEHPRRCLDTNHWNGRETIRDNTLALVENSLLVITHYSTAISYAVLFSKPIMLVTTNEYFSSYRKDRFISYSKALNKKVINVDDYNDNEITSSKLFNVDLSIYKKYIEIYLKEKSSARKNLWQIVIENLDHK